MKKNYIEPQMKVRTIRCSQMVCESPEYIKVKQSLGEDYEKDAWAW